MGKTAETPRHLHWVAPRSAHRGLIANNPWLPAACTQAVALFSDETLHVPATVLAASHEAAIDYIAQAPVLVLAASGNSDLAVRSDREAAAARFKVLCNARPRLKDLMRFYALAPQLRALSGHALNRYRYQLFKPLSAIPPSRLAQCIPKTAGEQNAWLDTAERWRSLASRITSDTDWIVAWAAGNSCHTANVPDITDILDFACREKEAFDERWSIEEAAAASERWHVEITERVYGESYSAEQLSVAADYGPLPLTIDIGEHTFVALQTRAQVFAEGTAMRHCVAMYANDVFDGRCWLYSVSRNGVRVATLELRRAGNGYRAIQLKGPCNNAAGPAATSDTAHFLDLVNVRAERAA